MHDPACVCHTPRKGPYAPDYPFMGIVRQLHLIVLKQIYGLPDKKKENDSPVRIIGGTSG